MVTAALWQPFKDTNRKKKSKHKALAFILFMGIMICVD